MLRAMQVSPNRILVLVVLGVLAASGCAYGEVRQVIRAQFASDYNCPEVQLRKRDTWYAQDNPNQFKVTGCGKVRTYTCDQDVGLVSYDKPACKWVEGDADAPGAANAEPNNPATESMPEQNAAPPPPSDDSSSGSSSSDDSSSSSSSSDSDGLDSSADITSDSSSSSDSGKKGGKAKASIGVKAGHK
jgi:hypothetical protein